jgi:hypothetical protein
MRTRICEYLFEGHACLCFKDAPFLIGMPSPLYINLNSRPEVGIAERYDFKKIAIFFSGLFSQFFYRIPKIMTP